MKKLLFLFLTVSTYGFSQTPVLISDFNAGTENGFELEDFSPQNFESIPFGDGFIFSLNSPEDGLELGIYENGSVRVIKDINPGVESSEPRGFTFHNDKVYFSAYDGEGRGRLWETDGTEEGTIAIMTLGDSQYREPAGFISSASGQLYFTYGAQLLSYVDGLLDTLDYVISFGIEDDGNNNYCAFEDGIAFIDDFNYGDFVRLYKIENGEITPLATSEEISFAASFDGLTPVDGGLYFKINGNNDAKGVYFYNKIDSSLNTVTLNDEKVEVNRIYSLDNTKAISFDIDTGFYIFRGDKSELIYEYTEIDFFYKESLTRVSYEDNFIFLAKSSDFYSYESLLIHSDGTKEGTKEIAELNYYNSNIVVDGKYAYFADGIVNGFEPTIYKINIETGEAERLYEYILSSDNLHSIHLLGVVDDQLLYISNLDTEVGRELYSINTEGSVAVSELMEEELEVEIYDDHFKITHGQNIDASISIYNVAGQRVNDIATRTNAMVPLMQGEGMFIYHISCDGNERVLKLNGFTGR